MNITKQPNYRKIFLDIILYKFPDKLEICKPLLEKKKLTQLDILYLNEYLYPKKNSEYSSKHKSYDKTTIIEILEYQKIHNLNNSQLAIHFKLSRNSVTKWKKMFIV